ncbi:hypothetical protein IscW_ISCW004867 [Ixodes scapularis]|uniref:Uncharacterized protein n=1 Tax=Ixodes scapularis TaxID=6945 RepID=B7PG78_IXOSC|nr:hypothetical protein IscW_ISCW004867 [Ixodes scapularis]|eukprot:XP_002434200.1 hypothetical protein IscW_ISCW004867 [Ixodes scapularis]
MWKISRFANRNGKGRGSPLHGSSIEVLIDLKELTADRWRRRLHQSERRNCGQ